MFERALLIIAGLAGCGGVVLGALVAHALKSRLDTAALTQVETASRYLLVHALLLVLIALLARADAQAIAMKVAGGATVTGIILFCGGLSLSALSGVKVFSAGAPLGGLAFMLGWLCMTYYGFSKL